MSTTIEFDQFVSDLQDHIEDVTTFYVSTDELREVLTRMRNDGHTSIPGPEPRPAEAAHDTVLTRDTDTGELRIYDVIAGQG